MNSLVIGQLKETLKNFNLPMIPVYTNESIPYEGRSYIKDNNIVRYSDGKFTKIDTYFYNKKITNLTKNFNIKSAVYDSYTHDYLGEYLRFLRDFKNLDLMSLYNCFYGERPLRVDKAYGNFRVNTYDDSYDYFIVPVKFNNYYSIFLNSETSFDVCCILYNDSLIDFSDIVLKSHKKIPGLKLNKPFIFSTYLYEDSDNKNWQYENDLKLLLKLPKSIKSSIVILEGSYISQSIDFVNVGKTVASTDTLSKNSMISYSSQSKYFSDRLIEYILNNAITNNDNIWTNVAWVQDHLYKTGIEGIYGIWDNSIKNNVIDLIETYVPSTANLSNLISDGNYSEEGLIWSEGKKFTRRFKDSNFDLTGYVDKDVETLLESA